MTLPSHAWAFIAMLGFAQYGDLPVPNEPLKVPKPPPWTPSSSALPPGPFSQTCRNIVVDWHLGRLNAECRRQNGSYAQVVNFEFRFCKPGSLSNADGRLTCQIDQDAVADEAFWQRSRQREEAEKAAAQEKADALQADKQALRPGMDAASMVVFGTRLTAFYYDYLYALFRKADPSTPASDVGREALFRYLIGVLTAPKSTAWREYAINFAFLSALGRPATAAEKQAYDPKLLNGDLWSQRVGAIERTKMNASPALRDQMIQRAFNAAYGRAPSAAEAASWRPKKEDYTATVELLRSNLYSPTGSKELTDTVKRALAHASQPNGLIFASEAVARCQSRRQVYHEMIQYDSCTVPKTPGH